MNPINWINENRDLTKTTGSFRLLTEAEWEYAARAGTTTRYPFGDDFLQIGDYAWYDGNAGGKSHPVGQKKANAWGLYDMIGNVYEWTFDFYGNYPTRSVANPQGPTSGASHVFRGGGWGCNGWGCSPSYRHFDPANSVSTRDGIGFRLVMNIE